MYIINIVYRMMRLVDNNLFSTLSYLLFVYSIIIHNETIYL